AGPAPRPRTRRALRRALHGGAGRGAQPNRRVTAAWPDAPQQDRQLRRHGRPGRPGRGGDLRRHLDHPERDRAAADPRRLTALALFGPTAVGKTGVAIAVAQRLRERGEEPVAVNCDAIQVYRGLETLSGAASAEERERLEHRLLSFVDPGEEFSAGRYAEA